MEKSRKWRWGINRWLILLFVILGFIAARYYPPILPHIQLPAEHLSTQPLFSLPILGEFYFTNTLLATIITDLILIWIALIVNRAVKSGNLVPGGFAGAIEALVEVMYNLTESTAGKWARQIFPFFGTLTFLVLVANWLELLPGVDSVGFFDPHHIHHPELCTFTPVLGQEWLINVGGDNECSAGVVPWVRVSSTDLNFTVALALIAVFMTQVFGVKAGGGSYFAKFFNVKGIFTRPIFGVIDFAVGILETVSEISKILSFSFRLFGNIFAGMVLLFVIGTLVPVFAQSLFLGLEFFVGLIQAFVIGMLAMVFMAQATQAHVSHDEHVEELPIDSARA